MPGAARACAAFVHALGSWVVRFQRFTLRHACCVLDLTQPLLTDSVWKENTLCLHT